MKNRANWKGTATRITPKSKAEAQAKKDEIEWRWAGRVIANPNGFTAEQVARALTILPV